MDDQNTGPSETTIRIVIVDDHAAVRTAIKNLVERQPDLTVVGEAANGDAGLATIAEMQPDVLLLDLSMPGMSGLEVLEHLRDREWKPRIVVVSMNDDAEHIREATARGAAAFVPKSEILRSLLPAIRGVATRPNVPGEGLNP